MGLSSTELNVIKVFADSREASSGLIASRIMITPGYADYLCKCLVKEGYLELTNQGTYRLTHQGKEALTGRTSRPLWDEGTIKAIAKELSKHLEGIVPTLTKAAKELKRVAKPKEPARPEIKIRESFIDPLEQGVKLKHKFSQKLKESRTSGYGLEKTLKALKKVSK